MLARHPGADPVTVAEHARLGGDVALAANALRDAAARAAEQVDHAAAEALLDDAVELRPGPELWLDRARVRTRLTHYDAALDDVERAITAGVGPGALEVGAWASYFDRRFADAARFADDGVLAADNRRARAAAWRSGAGSGTRPATCPARNGSSTDALSRGRGADRVTAAAWLGVLRAHRGRPDEALALLPPGLPRARSAPSTPRRHFTRCCSSATPTRWLATRPWHSTRSPGTRRRCERRQVPRFAGRAVNFAGWVLRSLGARRRRATITARRSTPGRNRGTAEVTSRRSRTWPNAAWTIATLAGTQSRLGEARVLLDGGMTWCSAGGLSLKLQLLLSPGGSRCRPATRSWRWPARPMSWRRGAAALGSAPLRQRGRLLRRRARTALGLLVELARVAADLDLLERSVAVEAWWWTGDVAADLGGPAWLELGRAAGRPAHRERRRARRAPSAPEPPPGATAGSE